MPIPGSNLRNPDGELDRRSLLQVAMCEEDHFVNEGIVYHLHHDDSLIDTASAFLELRIPADEELHLDELAIWTTIPLLNVILRENPTIGTPGTNAVPIINRNRTDKDGGRASVVTAFDDPATIADGTILGQRQTGAGDDENAFLLVGTTKMILGGKAAQSIYTLELENVGGATGTVALQMVWHEIASEA